jgi:hypothetical protein
MKTCSLIRAMSVIFTCVLTIGSADAATVIHVPADQPTIQAAINVAVNGDTVLVSPGTYLSGHPKPANEGHLKTGQRE